MCKIHSFSSTRKKLTGAINIKIYYIKGATDTHSPWYNWGDAIYLDFDEHHRRVNRFFIIKYHCRELWLTPFWFIKVSITLEVSIISNHWLMKIVITLTTILEPISLEANETLGLKVSGNYMLEFMTAIMSFSFSRRFLVSPKLGNRGRTIKRSRDFDFVKWKTSVHLNYYYANFQLNSNSLKEVKNLYFSKITIASAFFHMDVNSIYHRKQARV